MEEDDDLEQSLSNTDHSNEVIGPDWIGNIRCFWPDKNGRPRITIGPNWGFTIFLGALVSGCLYISVIALISMGEKGAAWYWMLIGSLIIIFGVGSFFMTFLGDPGIPEEVYQSYARPYAKRERLPAINEKGFRLCEECDVYLIPTREHCDLCEVCIDHPDHHCVFYSKCIGGGNVVYFRLSLLMFVVNMTYFFLVFGLISMTSRHKSHEGGSTGSHHNLLLL
mmetsp:Transcript_15186/g.19232  ORF Transcript_15186/g.19232 Transcript_15186/m.19232 type:complete len:223 (-) Transcript_15186:82-750(-)|eukprot:CAMPEP_0170467324 /NCGR_PEP_ID=MMETSP0123-20130129/10945_1 /TAXON_ID=182087 /ORGANISM="Favella ehrenbergii, Strain Fehren 1" /LENGTH=222 /DNA_ID=CAMNT_0010733661 /DNA_START=429 /DNA_END=1097 /DNA_ORIENTATION=+